MPEKRTADNVVSSTVASSSDSAPSENNFDDNGDNNITNIAFKFDDFLVECAPSGQNVLSEPSNKTDHLKKLLRTLKEINISKENIQLDSNTPNFDEVLKEIFEMQYQSGQLAVENEIEEMRLSKESNILEKCIEAVKAELETQHEEDDCDLKSIQQDFTKHKTMLNDIITSIFKNYSPEVSLLLSDLMKKQFDCDDEYLNLGDERFSDQVVDSLVDIGILEYHPEDNTLVKMVKLCP